MSNKVKYGFSNVHYAVLNSDEDGTATYATPVPIPGDVSLTMNAQGNKKKFYASDYAYFVSFFADGYEGTLEIANLPDSFRKDVLKEVEDIAAGTLAEKSGVIPARFALLFEVNGDENKTRWVFYNCAVSRPSVNANTTTDGIEPTTDTLDLSADALTSGFVQNHTTKADGTAYAGWFESVVQPTAAKS